MACLPVASDGALGEAACYAPTAHTPQALTVDPAGAFVYAGGGPRRTGGAHPAPDWTPPEPTAQAQQKLLQRPWGQKTQALSEKRWWADPARPVDWTIETPPDT